MQANRSRWLTYYYFLKDKFFFYRIYLFLIVLVFGLLLGACIEEFTPKLSGSTQLMVINGSIIKGDSIQKVFVSQSTPIGDSIFYPMPGCHVFVTDVEGKEFIFKEHLDGEYLAEIPQEFLAYNTEFKLNVVTADGNEFESDYDMILESSLVDSLYYLIEYYQSSSISSSQGVQFYADLKAKSSATKNYRWILEETWETHTPEIMKFVWNFLYSRGDSIPEPWEKFRVCYKTEIAPDIYTSSTKNLIVNEKKKIPLRYFPETNYKVSHNYSALVRQYALSDMAYGYWSRSQVATAETGGLYQTQPSMSISNICNLNDPDEVVLGFFWASSYTEKRINFKGPINGIYYPYPCYGFLIIKDPPNPTVVPNFNPTYIVEVPIDEFNKFPWAWKNPWCFDCTIHDGTLVKPDFFK